MNLANLRKSSPTAKQQLSNEISVDAFIDDAEHYSQGRPHLYALSEAAQRDSADTQKMMRRATFSLGEQAIEQLRALSEQSGISRSRLIRIWADHYSYAYYDELLLSKVV